MVFYRNPTGNLFVSVFPEDLVPFFPLEIEVENVGASCAEMEELTTCSTSPRSLTDHLDEGRNRGSPTRRTDSPSKKKGVTMQGMMYGF